uniref:Uncharacterized protein apoA n=1 Tax=Amycolatopsis sp. FU40 TaxID=2914159 RepID=G4XIN5_9PSEU|nr:unknown [Amycolatopsis sp. FU40]
MHRRCSSPTTELRNTCGGSADPGGSRPGGPEATRERSILLGRSPAQHRDRPAVVARLKRADEILAGAAQNQRTRIQIQLCRHRRPDAAQAGFQVLSLNDGPGREHHDLAGTVRGQELETGSPDRFHDRESLPQRRRDVCPGKPVTHSDREVGVFGQREIFPDSGLQLLQSQAAVGREHEIQHISVELLLVEPKVCITALLRIAEEVQVFVVEPMLDSHRPNRPAHGLRSSLPRFPRSGTVEGGDKPPARTLRIASDDLRRDRTELAGQRPAPLDRLGEVRSVDPDTDTDFDSSRGQTHQCVARPCGEILALLFLLAHVISLADCWSSPATTAAARSNCSLAASSSPRVCRQAPNRFRTSISAHGDIWSVNAPSARK